KGIAGQRNQNFCAKHVLSAPGAKCTHKARAANFDPLPNKPVRVRIARASPVVGSGSTVPTSSPVAGGLLRADPSKGICQPDPGFYTDPRRNTAQGLQNTSNPGWSQRFRAVVFLSYGALSEPTCKARLGSREATKHLAVMSYAVSGGLACATRCRRRSHSSEAKRFGPTSISRGIILKTATRVHGLPLRIRKPFSFRLLTMAE